MTRARRVAALAAIVAALACGLDRETLAHSGLRFSSPLGGVTLGDGPTEVRLTFLEEPEVTLASVRVVDTNGDAFHAGAPRIVEEDPLSLAVPLRAVGRGVYTVHWRVVSAVDGHASSGVFVFGVLMDPSGSAPAAAAETATSAIEVVARSILLTGLILLLGAAGAVTLRFGAGREVALASIAWVVSIAGVLLLAAAQAQAAGVGVVALLQTAIGRALAWRMLALAAAGGGIAVAAAGVRAGRTRITAAGLIVAASATLASIVAHASAGHAAAGRWPVVPTIALQVMHFAAAAMWLGGLAVLVAGLKGAPSDERTASIRRFSTMAAIGLSIVVVSGIARAFQEVSAWRDLIATPYGLLISAKIVLLALVAALGAVNRWRAVPAASSDLRPLRRTATAELAIALVAVVAAGFLGALPPPAAARSIAGIAASGSDFGTTVRARFSAASDQPGPNRFVVHVDDYDAETPVVADRVSLRFAPIDDPGIAPTVLALTRAPDGSYTGAGANLSFTGRWRIGVLVERRGSSVEVPIEVETHEPQQFVRVLRAPGEPAAYTVQVGKLGHVRIVPSSDQPGPATLQITIMTVIYEVLPVDYVVVTSGVDFVKQLPVTRQDRNHFTATVELGRGTNRFTVVGRTDSGMRLRAVLTIDIAQNQ